MPIETERKFLVTGTGWKEGATGTRISQGYLSLDPARTVRVRVAGDRAFLTIKGISRGLSRQEFEYPIPRDDAGQLLSLCLPAIVTKTRYYVEAKGHLWEVDVFHGDNEGLVMAEIELSCATEHVELPDWAGAEVSGDQRYYNASLAQHPYCTWHSEPAR